ncbi:MAG: o-succinylbenzoate synthase [Egibacteraceae bacterium]
MRLFSIPMRERFRGVERRVGALIEGPCGWGEFSPFPEYPPETCARWLAAAREAATRPWPRPVRDRIPVNVTVPAVGPEQAWAIVAASTCATAKVKVAEPGQGIADDLARVEAVRDALGPRGRIRVDANGAWDPDDAVSAIRQLDRYGLEYVEQPCRTLEEMARVRLRVDVPLAADESVRTAEDPLHVANLDAADLVVLKVQPLGGVWAAMEVAEAAKLPVVVSSAVETSIGIAAGIAFAAALPELPFACGLATVALLEGDVVADPLLPVDGVIAVRRPTVDPEALGRYELVGAEAGRVLDRMAAADRLSWPGM